MELGHEACPVSVAAELARPVAKRRTTGAADSPPAGRVTRPVRGKDRVSPARRSARRRGIAVGMLSGRRRVAGRSAGSGSSRTTARRPRPAARAGRPSRQQFSPFVAIDEAESPESLFLDATGCGFGFGGEAAFAEKVVNAVRQRGYWAFVAALADTVGAAWAVARYGATRCSNPSVSAFASSPREQVGALRPLPVESLRLPGRRRPGAAGAECRPGRTTPHPAPRAQLPSRFGDGVAGRASTGRPGARRKG